MDAWLHHGHEAALGDRCEYGVGVDQCMWVQWLKRRWNSERRSIVRRRGGRGATRGPDQDTITQLVSSIRRVGRVVPGGGEAIAQVCTAHDYTTAGKPVIDWDEPGAKDTLVSALVNDANALLEVFAGIDDQGAGRVGTVGVGVAGVGCWTRRRTSRGL